MSYVDPGEPRTLISRATVSSADNADEATFRAAVGDAAFCGGMTTLAVKGSFSASGANAVARIAYYSVDANGTETFEFMDAAQTITASSQTSSSRYIGDQALLFPTYGYTKIRLYISSISSGNVSLDVEGK